MTRNILNELVQIVGKENVLVDEPMKKHTTFRIGGPADYLVMPSLTQQIARIVKLCQELEVPYFVMGNGSNLLVSDEGFHGVILQIYDRFHGINWNENRATVQAGCLLSRFGKEAAEHSLTGFEFATGIPGTMGGAVAMNAGAYGGEMKDCLASVTMMDTKGNIRKYPKEELELGYRTSAASKYNLIVLEAEVELQPGNAEEIQQKLTALKNARKEKQPLEYPSAGSTFKRPEGYFAGKLIQDAGFKGYKHGGAMISDKHSGFVINYNNATARDVLELIQTVQKGVLEQFGVKLEMEVKKLGEI